jgi:hypothetical protein
MQLPRNSLIPARGVTSKGQDNTLAAASDNCLTLSPPALIYIGRNTPSSRTVVTLKMQDMHNLVDLAG